MSTCNVSSYTRFNDEKLVMQMCGSHGYDLVDDEEEYVSGPLADVSVSEISICCTNE